MVRVSEMDQRLVRLAAAARRAREGWEDARKARDEAVRDAEELGWTFAAIADRTGLSVSQVGRIAVAQHAEAQDAEDASPIDNH
jgi:hypothetical protein